MIVFLDRLRRGARVTCLVGGKCVKYGGWRVARCSMDMYCLAMLFRNVVWQCCLGVVHNCHHFHERTQRTLEGGGQGRPYAFLNVVYSDGNEIIAHVRRTSMTKNPLVRNSLLVQKLVT